MKTSLDKKYLEKNIFCIENFISQEDIKLILEEIDKVPENDIYKHHAVHQSYPTPNLDLIWQKYNKSLCEIFRDDTQYYRSLGTPSFIVYKDEVDLEHRRRPEDEWLMFPHADCTEDTYIDHDGVVANVVSGLVIFITDDFDGGELKYTNKNVIIKPKSGMLVSHPGTLEYEHGVLRFQGNRRIIFSGMTYANV